MRPRRRRPRAWLLAILLLGLAWATTSAVTWWNARPASLEAVLAREPACAGFVVEEPPALPGPYVKHVEPIPVPAGPDVRNAVVVTTAAGPVRVTSRPDKDRLVVPLRTSDGRVAVAVLVRK